MRPALILLAVILLATSGQAIDVIQAGSDISYFAYKIEVSENQTTIWTDASTIQFLDEQPGTVFIGVN